MKDEPIKDPPVENLGPAMLALTAQQRRFVVGWIAARGKNASRIARAAGYQGEVAARVNAHHLIRNPKVLAALKEEADRQLDAAAVLAVLGLHDLMGSKNEKVRLEAVNSALDRTGYGRRTTQDIRVEHVDSRSTEDLMRLVQQFSQGALPGPAVEGEFVEVAGGESPEA